ncbi:hypothetical protein [Horticoccus sp. 23ND18S-11]|uniref:hypothetical protein n=1 Tax=Horticoccus sp. 23ND18S-11 TaxID=3391832 RepID=UPI0039C9A4BD
MQHRIEFWYVPATDKFAYKITPRNPNGAKRAKVKHRDQMRWRCDDGSWKVTFKNETPLIDGFGNPIFEVTGGAGGTFGGYISAATPASTSYPYSVEVDLGDGGPPKQEDPEIIIDDFPDMSRRRKVGSTRNKPGPQRPKKKKRKKK